MLARIHANEVTMSGTAHSFKAHVIADIQNDLCASSSFPVPQGDQGDPVPNRWIATAAGRRIWGLASRNWRPAYSIIGVREVYTYTPVLTGT